MDKKVYESVISGKSDNNIKYTDFQSLIIGLGFEFVRQNGSHEIYSNKKIQKSMNIQNDGSKAKAYQVRQVLEAIRRLERLEEENEI